MWCGYRRFSVERASWKGPLLYVQARGLVIDPKLATGDGTLGIWKALGHVYPIAREHRHWVNNAASLLVHSILSSPSCGATTCWRRADPTATTPASSAGRCFRHPASAKCLTPALRDRGCSCVVPQEDCKVGLAEQRQGWQRSYGFVGGANHFWGAVFMEVLYDAPSSGVAG